MNLHADMGGSLSRGQAEFPVWAVGLRLWSGVRVAAGAARALQADMRGLATSRRAVRRAGAAV
jgi:hypothetical protein